MLADYAKRKGFRSILRIDRHDEIYSHRFMDAFARKGIPMDPGHYLQPANIGKQLPDKLREFQPDLIISEGGFYVYKEICGLLNALPKKDRPELLIRDAGNLPEDGIASLYPGIKFAGKMKNDFERIGREAALMMAEHIQTGKPLGQKKIRCFSIQPL